ncbi:MAG: BON domain-containing protein [Tahibacter sp.]
MKTDIQLQQDVMAELQWTPSIKATHIGVEVNNGVVTLAGTVETFGEKWEAESAAQRVQGVKALAVELQVKLPLDMERSDAEIAESAVNILQWTAAPLKDAVHVVVEKGWITLSGEMVWQYQRLAAADAVRNVRGVTGVSNQIAIKPVVTLHAVKADIEAALKRGASSDARRINVGVDGTDVTLSGSVHSWSEHDLAKRSAWNTPGVTRVVDNLIVEPYR